MPLKTTRFDAADYIETPADVAGFLALAFADNDPDEIRDAIAVVARSRGMATLAAKAKLNPKSLYRTLGPNGNPEFATVLRILQALGITLTPTVKPSRSRSLRKAA